MRKAWRRTWRLLLLAAGVALAATALQVLALRWLEPRNTAWMKLRERQAREQNREYRIHHTWLPLARIPRPVRDAVVAAEDSKFWRHNGFDWEAIRAARDRNERAERIKRGGSTITQQLAKNLFLSPRRSYVRKAREAVITVFMELLLPKERILELYLNSIEWGPGVFGIAEAARHHYGVEASRLSVDQACRLAALIPAPLRYRVDGEYVGRRAEALARMIGG